MKILRVFVAVMVSLAIHATAQTVAPTALTYTWPTVSTTGQLGNYLIFSNLNIPRPTNYRLNWTDSGTAPSGCTFNLQGSADGVTWLSVDGGSAVSCTASGAENVINTPVTYLRVNVVSYVAGDGTTAVVFRYTGANSSNAGGVTSLNNLTGGLTLAAGSNITITPSGNTLTFASSGGGGSGTVTNIATTAPITGGPITTTGTIACATCTTSAAALTSNAVLLGGGSQAIVAATQALAGAGAAVPTGPTSSTSGDLVSFTGTAGQIQDSGKALTGVGAGVTTGPTTSVNNNGVCFTSTAGQIQDCKAAAVAMNLATVDAASGSNVFGATSGVNSSTVTIFAVGTATRPELTLKGFASQTGCHFCLQDSAGDDLYDVFPQAAGSQAPVVRIYKTLETTPTNFERLNIFGDATNQVIRIDSDSGGTGTQRNIALDYAGGTVQIGGSGTANLLMAAAGGHINSASANTDVEGTISISSATSAAHTFSTNYTNAPNCTLTPQADPTTVGVYWVTTSTSGVTANVKVSGTIAFTYHCFAATN